MIPADLAYIFLQLMLRNATTNRHPRKEVKGMNDEQEKRVVEALVDFVLRVAKGNATNESEVAVLPLVAKELFEVLRLH